MAKIDLLHCVYYFVIPQRFVVSMLCLLGLVVSYAQRVALSIAITKIVSTTVRAYINECLPGNETISEEMGPTVPWKEGTQQYILLSFFIGYFVGHIPAGLCSDSFGPRVTYFWGVLISTIMTAATPLSIINMHWMIVFAIRATCGLAQSILYPCISILLVRYVPPQERGMMGAFSMAASALGLLFGNLLTGAITNYMKDWRWAFYFWMLLGAGWCYLCYLYVYDDVETNPRILDDEKQFLLDKIPRSQKFKIPWKGIITDRAVLGLMVGSLGSDFWIYLMLTNIPKYMGNVLHMNMRTLSLATSLPSLLLWVSSIISGKIVDWVASMKKSNLKWNRRITSVVGVVLPLGFTAAMGHAGCNTDAVVTLYCLANAARGPYYCSVRVNHLDLTQNFCGIVMALINGFGCLAGILAPLLVKHLAANNTLRGWCFVFWVTCVMNLACHAVYFFTAQADRAKWDEEPSVDSPEPESESD